MADVVSARDLREFILTDLELLRIPQWAILSEAYWGDFNLQIAAIPVPTFDNNGEPGGDYYPIQNFTNNGASIVVSSPQKPETTLSNGSWGLRFSYLFSGWDVSSFFYQSYNREAKPVRSLNLPIINVNPTYFRTNQYGLTFSKSLNDYVFKGEYVYTKGNQAITGDLFDSDGLVDQDKAAYALSFEPSWITGGQLMFQFARTVLVNKPINVLEDEIQDIVGFLVSKAFFDDQLELQLISLFGTTRGDQLIRPKLDWSFITNWRWRIGVDLFSGPEESQFGLFDNADRAYTEIQYVF